MKVLLTMQIGKRFQNRIKFTTAESKILAPTENKDQEHFLKRAYHQVIPAIILKLKIHAKSNQLKSNIVCI